MKSNFPSMLLVTLVAAVSCGCASWSKLEKAGVFCRDGDGRPALNLLAISDAFSEDCGLQCLEVVFEHWGRPTTVKELKRVAGKTPNRGYTIGQLADVARSYGFSAYVVPGTLDELEQHCSLGRPCIVVLRTDGQANHAVVVHAVHRGTRPYEGTTATVVDRSAHTVEEMKVSALLPRWNALGAPMLLIAVKTEGGGNLSR